MGRVLADTIYCRTNNFEKELGDFFRQKGYGVGVSTVSITAGHHGTHEVKRLDILRNGVLNETTSPETNDIKAQFEKGEALSDAAIRHLIGQAQKADRYEKGLNEIGELYKDTGKTVLDATGMLVLSRHVLDLRNEY